MYTFININITITIYNKNNKGKLVLFIFNIQNLKFRIIKTNTKSNLLSFIIIEVSTL